MPIEVERRQSLYSRQQANHVGNKRGSMLHSTCIDAESVLPTSKTSLVDTLPVELQIEIFFQCLPPYPTFSIDEAPLTLACVCRMWKYLVFNTAKLWSAFEIKADYRSLKPATNLKLKQLLMRSKQCPLSIKCPNRYFPGPPGTAQFEEILALLEPEAHRWKDIELTAPLTDFPAAQHILLQHLPSLRSLSLVFLGRYCKSVPPLHLSLRHLPWGQLTLIELFPENPILLDLDGCLDILSQTKRLKECTLNLLCTMDLVNTHQRHGTMVHLPMLNKLTLCLQIIVGARSESPEASLVRFLNIISVPQLEDLQLRWEGPPQRAVYRNDQDQLDLFSFFDSISETLRSLTITYLLFSEKALRQCLSYLNHLTHLVLKYTLSDIYDDPITDSFLSSCTLKTVPAIVLDDDYAVKNPRPTTNLPLLPMLEHCEIESHGRGYTSAGLIAFIQSRSKDAPFRSDSDPQFGVMKSCRILSATNLIYDDEIEDYTRKWKSSGMDITIDSLVIR